MRPHNSGIGGRFEPDYAIGEGLTFYIFKDRIIKTTNWIFEGILPQYVRDKDGNFVGEKINNDF